MFLLQHFRPVLLGPAIAACLGTPAHAAPTDRDYETVVPAPRPAPAVPAPPPGLALSPLAIRRTPAGSQPGMRFVMRDGTVLVAEVLGFDGRMYALRLPHSTLLARKDLFTAVTPIPAGVVRKQATRPVRAASPRPGARY